MFHITATPKGRCVSSVVDRSGGEAGWCSLVSCRTRQAHQACVVLPGTMCYPEPPFASLQYSSHQSGSSCKEGWKRWKPINRRRVAHPIQDRHVDPDKGKVICFIPYRPRQHPVTLRQFRGCSLYESYISSSSGRTCPAHLARYI